MLLAISTFNTLSGAFGLFLIGAGYVRWRRGAAIGAAEEDAASDGSS